MEITKRAWQYTNFKDTVVRLGNVDKSGSGLVKFGDENTLVGCQTIETTDDEESVHVFNLAQAASGRFMTVSCFPESLKCPSCATYFSDRSNSNELYSSASDATN